MRKPSPVLLGRALELARRRARWLVRAPAVGRDRPRMFPGALSSGEEEEQAVVDAVREVVRSKQLSRSISVSGRPLVRSRVDRLERQFARRIDARHALAVNSGTSALVCALAALRIGPGDEVIVPAYTWFSTATAVLAVGAVPVIAEVDRSLTIDPGDLARRISPHTRAVIAVHMRGAPADMEALPRICSDHGLHLIEDVAQALGASFRGAPLGSFGALGTFSFEMSKLITAGEGGIVVTSDPALHRLATMYHDSAAAPRIGASPAEWVAGLNMRMSELHAAVLVAQLDRLDLLIQRMRSNKQRLLERITGPLEARGASLRTRHDPDGDAALAIIFFLPEADAVPALVRRLADENVPATRLFHDLAHLPRDIVDLHTYPAWLPVIEKRSWSRSGEPWRSHPRQIQYDAGDCPRTIELLRRAVHLDVSPDLTPEHVREIGNAVVRAVLDE